MLAVIIVVGVLASIAVPKFLDLQRSATIASMQGLQGALNSAVSLSFARSAADGVQNEAMATITVNGQLIDVVYGFPAGTQSGIGTMVVSPSSDWQQRPSTHLGAYVYWPSRFDVDAWPAQCFIRYRQSTGVGNAPVIDFYTGSASGSGC